MARLKESDVREKMEEAIEKQHSIAIDSSDKGKSTNAANALSGLVSRYKEMFGFEPEEFKGLERVGEKKITGYKK